MMLSVNTPIDNRKSQAATIGRMRYLAASCGELTPRPDEVGIKNNFAVSFTLTQEGCLLNFPISYFLNFLFSYQTLANLP